MRITDVRTVLLTGPSTDDPFETRRRRSAAFIEVHTDAGLVGLGETYAGYFCPEAVPAIVEFFAPVVIGQGVDDIDELWRRMFRCGNFWYRTGLGAIVLTGIEAALSKQEAAARFELPADRLGDLVVVSTKHKVLGTSASRHDLSGLSEPLRSHGGISEQKVPLLCNRKLAADGASRPWRNFDAFDLALNLVA